MRSFHFTAVACLIAACGSVASANQGIELVMRRGLAVPDANGNPTPFFWRASNIDNPAINNAGIVLFYGQLDTAIGGDDNNPLPTTADRGGIYYGTPGSVRMIARDGGLSGYPTIPNINNWRHNSTTNIGGLASAPAMTPNGTIYISSQLNGVGATGTNNTTSWTGPVNNLDQIAQRGVAGPLGQAPGTGGAVWNSQMNLSTTQLRVNDAGQVTFNATISGPGVTTADDTGIWIGKPGATQLVMRENDAPIDYPTTRFDTAATFGLALNNGGKTAFVNNLKLGVGGVSDADNAVLVGTFSGSLRVIARDGFDQGLPAGLLYTQVSNFSPGISLLGNSSLTRDNKLYFNANLGGVGVTAANNSALMVSNNGATPSIVYRKGDAAPIPGALWGNSASSSVVGGGGHVLIGNILQDNGGGTITTANDEVALLRDPISGNYTTIAREGDLISAYAPAANLLGLPSDARFASNIVSSGAYALNDLGQALFSATFTGTGIDNNNNRAIFTYQPGVGLNLVVRTGTIYDPSMGPTTLISFFNSYTGEGTANALSNSGWGAVRIGDAFGNNAIYRFFIPTPGTGLFVLSGLALAARRRRN